MKRVLLFFILTTIAFIGTTQPAFTNKSIALYKFKDLNIILCSQSMVDTSVKGASQYIQLPNKNTFSVHGGYLLMLITSTKEPFRNPPGTMLIDTLTGDGEMMKLQDLEIKFNDNPLVKDPWRDISQFPYHNDTTITLYFSKGSVPIKKGGFYQLVAQFSMAYGLQNITIRHKRTKKELLHLVLKSVGMPARPSLSFFTQNKQDEKRIDSFVDNESNKRWMPPGDASVGPDRSKILRNENLPGSSNFMLYFKKAGQEYPDSSMEYRLLSETDVDTAWINTGHKLIITQLRPGNHYRLQIRYILHPAYMQEHTFYVVPKWYQTVQSKIILACLIVLAILAAWLLTYRKRMDKIRKKRERLSLEIKAIRSQLNPHFIFNALSSIQGLINGNDVSAANQYLTEFSKLLRESLRNNDKETVPLITELNLLTTYLKLEQLRFHFQYELKIDEAINSNATEIPYLLLQPLIENAIKHGVSSLGERGFITIHFIKKHNDLLVSITDNGNGFIETAPVSGFGLKLTKDRISLINQTLKNQPVQLTINSKPDTGTIIHLIFKNWL